MSPLSVVIITHNEEHNIADCIRSARLVSNDIIVVDAGSSDRTTQLAITSGARVYSIHWEGYGYSRNYGAARAKNQWILALDADERIGAELASSVRELNLDNSNVIYRFRRINFLGQQKFRFGTLGFETVKRIYNRNYSSWDLTLVHERLESTNPAKKRIRGHIDHYGLRNAEDYKAKAVLYAQMSAEKYFQEGKKISLLKRFSSPFFNSVKSYLLQVGFLDGARGWTSAKTIAYYSWLKYFYFHQLVRDSKIRKVSFPSKQRVERA